MLGDFSEFLVLLIFHKICNLMKKLFQEYGQTVRQFELFCLVGLQWSHTILVGNYGLYLLNIINTFFESVIFQYL